MTELFPTGGRAFIFTVHGTPAPQGSKRHVGKGVMVESSKAVRPWREAVKWAAIDRQKALRVDDEVLFPDGPVELAVAFFLARPGSHYRTGRFSTELRADAPTWVARTPDTSKLVRSTEDAITDAGLIWRDDAQVASIIARKFWSDTGFVGAEIMISRPLSDTDSLKINKGEMIMEWTDRVEQALIEAFGNGVAWADHKHAELVALAGRWETPIIDLAAGEDTSYCNGLAHAAGELRAVLDGDQS